VFTEGKPNSLVSLPRLAKRVQVAFEEPEI
jgi:hypothetical protein